MFCNGPRTDKGDIARLGPTTIAGMTSLKVLFVLGHDCGRYRWFGWAHQYRTRCNHHHKFTHNTTKNLCCTWHICQVSHIGRPKVCGTRQCVSDPTFIPVHHIPAHNTCPVLKHLRYMVRAYILLPQAKGTERT